VRPEIRYARNGDVALGYTAFGTGPGDLVYLAPFNNLDVLWENPLYAQFLRRLSSHARVVVVDRRGTGVSDRLSPRDLPPLEDLVDDLAAVLDAVGSDRATLFGFSDAGSLCAMFAATRPERVSGLILYATAARGTQAPDYPWQWTEAEWTDWLDRMRLGWGTRAFAEQSLPLFGPSLVGDERMLDWWERYQRLSASPSAIYAQEAVFRDIDIRSLLPAIAVPTLVLHRVDDAVEPVGAGRFLASRIAGAVYVELPGGDHLPWAGDQGGLVDEVVRFLDQVREDEEGSLNRVLATVLFTDIVGSTDTAVHLGDRAWSDLMGAHHARVRALLTRYRGREVDVAGDGFFAVFDGPARALRCSRSIVDDVRPLGLEVRAGVHTGEVELDDADVRGMAVHIGARIGALAGPGEVLVSSTVKDLVIGSGLSFDDRGQHVLKGIPDPWHLYALAREG
jgi:class 3 adenylate cyclase/pimeloyl-ACP methyl ester carboxylesterase